MEGGVWGQGKKQHVVIGSRTAVLVSGFGNRLAVRLIDGTLVVVDISERCMQCTVHAEWLNEGQDDLMRNGGESEGRLG